MAFISVYSKIISLCALTFSFGIFGIFILNKIYRGDFEKLLVILFIMSLPFFYDLNIVYQEDFHLVSKQYYRFNIVHIFSIIFIFFILKNIKIIKIDLDLILILIFNIVCIASIFYAINYKAAIFDYLRYLNISIIYIFFSRVFNYKKYSNVILNCFVYGACIQLVWGLLQKIKGGALGLYFLGEGRTVFRTNVSGYEMGMSGSFGHPGPFAIFNLFVLGFILFNNKISKKIRLFGIIVCSLNILLAAGRTSIVLLAIIYIFYYIKHYGKLNSKSIIGGSTIILTFVLIFLVFGDVFEPIINRFLESDMEMQLNSRFRHVELAMIYIKQNPIFGFGLNNYLDLTFRDFPMKFYSDFFLCNPIHNAYLLYMVEIGSLGLSIFLLLIIKNFIYLFKVFTTDKRDNLYVMQGYATVLVVYIIYNFQGWAGIQMRTLIMFMITSAFMYRNYKEIKNGTDEKVW